LSVSVHYLVREFKELPENNAGLIDLVWHDMEVSSGLVITVCWGEGWWIVRHDRCQ
jgi:hypothetical protein